MNENLSTQVEEKAAPKRLWLCVYGLHKWVTHPPTTMTEEVKGHYKRSHPVRVMTCERCALVLVKSLV